MVIGIIEDDNLLRKALDTSLQNQGYTTILAGSRKEAIKNIDRSVRLSLRMEFVPMTRDSRILQMTIWWKDLAGILYKL